MRANVIPYLLLQTRQRACDRHSHPARERGGPTPNNYKQASKQTDKQTNKQTNKQTSPNLRHRASEALIPTAAAACPSYRLRHSVSFVFCRRAAHCPSPSFPRSSSKWSEQSTTTPPLLNIITAFPLLIAILLQIPML
jgi:hypothetical protein